jgi:hypothetical protein
MRKICYDFLFSYISILGRDENFLPNANMLFHNLASHMS